MEMNWIKVEDRLPEVGQKVLLNQHKASFSVGFLGYNPLKMEYRFIVFTNSKPVTDFTHWAEITPPKD